MAAMPRGAAKRRFRPPGAGTLPDYPAAAHSIELCTPAAVCRTTSPLFERW
jgi:hypothetical protein